MLPRTAALASIGLWLAACGDAGRPEREPAGKAGQPPATQQPGATAAPGINRTMLEAFTPLPTSAPNKKNPGTPEKIALGKQLYFDARLSKNHDFSCNSCHDLSTYGVDNDPLSEGHKKQLGSRNSPTVYNAALHFRQFWDGRAEDVEEQATGPIGNPIEMASDEKRVVETLSSIPEYVDSFRKAFPGEDAPVTLANVGKAIGAFERTLIVPARWDKYLAGDDAALNDAEKHGLKTFIDAGCGSCHAGALVGGAMYQKLGLTLPWPDERDRGRFEVTKEETDKMYFKVPSLRNVTKTGPYFHDGSIATLEGAIMRMAKHQTAKPVDDTQAKSIALFLGALEAELPTDAIKQPALPKSTDKTPKPDPN